MICYSHGSFFNSREIDVGKPLILNILTLMYIYIILILDGFIFYDEIGKA